MDHLGELFVMDEDTLDDPSLAYVIDTYVSLIWTERYTSAGDVQLVVVASEFYMDLLKPGKFLRAWNTREIMRIETQSLDNNLLTIKGTSLLSILNQRYVWPMGYGTSPNGFVPVNYVDTARKPGDFISEVVRRFAITITWEWGDGVPTWHSMDELEEEIPNLTLGDIDYSGEVIELTAPMGPLYDAIKPVAESNNVGISLYLAPEIVNGKHTFKFKTYQGKDRTSAQNTNPLLRLLPENDDIYNIKELRSNAEDINVVYIWNSLALWKYKDGFPTPLNRRVRVIHPAITPEWFNEFDDSYGEKVYHPKVNANQLSKIFLNRGKKMHIVDAQVNQFTQYKLGVHYGLGDLIELKSPTTGEISTARITEHIRSYDSSGSKAYPTIEIE
jgi:hypothetical protein